jgi:hypothetical protein
MRSVAYKPKKKKKMINTERLRARANEVRGRVTRVRERVTGALSSRLRARLNGGVPESAAAFESAVQRIGLVEFPTLAERIRRKDLLVEQIRIGFDRIQRGEPPTQEDGGILAIPTDLPSHIDERDWTPVPVGDPGVTAEFAGTNWKVHSSKKQPDGSLALTQTHLVEYPEPDRKVSFDEFVTRLCTPLAEAHLTSHGDTPFNGFVALGFPHANVHTPGSPDVDAYFLFDDKGRGPKEWQITDWDPERDRNPETARRLGPAVRQKLTELGISQVESLVFINDTSAVALDRDAQRQAIDVLLLDFFPNGNVGGSGTNKTIKGVNTEIGHAFWPHDEIWQRMRDNGWTQNEKPEMETETGQYLSLRLAAGLQILGDEGLIPDAEAKAERIVRESKDDPAYISKLATGEVEADSQTQALALRVLRRAGQVYGIADAAAAESALGERTPDATPAAMLTEGSVVHKGYGIKETAETTAAELGQPVRIIEASGAKGVTFLGMSRKRLAQAA